MDPFGIAAMNATRRHVLSARPDSPIEPDPAQRHRRAGTVRRATAALLRRTADRLEPCCPDPYPTGAR
ncbi:hypothetical protein [Polymorphospora rubra]|uniref:hypothetical protein n=1 Tax=Polymorphospora rubra TaxID=338584 RepID=UPI0033E4F4C7